MLAIPGNDSLANPTRLSFAVRNTPALFNTLMSVNLSVASATRLFANINVISPPDGPTSLLLAVKSSIWSFVIPAVVFNKPACCPILYNAFSASVDFSIAFSKVLTLARLFPAANPFPTTNLFNALASANAFVALPTFVNLPTPANRPTK